MAKKELRGDFEENLKNGMADRAAMDFAIEGGASRRTAYIWLKEYRDRNPRAFPGSPIPGVDEGVAREIRAQGNAIVEQNEKRTAELIKKGGGVGYAQLVLDVAKDMAAVRETAMRGRNKGDIDPRVAISAAQAEASIIASAAKIVREMREASKENIMVHPQIVQFREDILRFIESKGLVDEFRELYVSHERD